MLPGSLLAGCGTGFTGMPASPIPSRWPHAWPFAVIDRPAGRGACTVVTVGPVGDLWRGNSVNTLPSRPPHQPPREPSTRGMLKGDPVKASHKGRPLLGPLHTPSSASPHHLTATPVWGLKVNFSSPFESNNICKGGHRVPGYYSFNTRSTRARLGPTALGTRRAQPRGPAWQIHAATSPDHNVSRETWHQHGPILECR